MYDVGSLLLEGGGLEAKACSLGEAENQIEILDGLAGGTFQEIVNRGYDKEFRAVFFKRYDSLVGVDGLLQVYRFV